MKKIQIAVLITLLIPIQMVGQGFITPLDDQSIVTIMGQPCKVYLPDGEVLEGEFRGATIIGGYLSKVNIRVNGEKTKLKPEDILRLEIKASRLAKFAMMSESSNSIREIVETDFDEIVNRDYLIFETAMRHNKKGKLRLMQLLNPGFDSKIKVYQDPNANETRGIGVAGVRMTGGVTKSYLFVENDEKAVKVKKSQYKKNFVELYSNCDKMIKTFSGDKIKWDDLAGHVFAYDQICN